MTVELVRPSGTPFVPPSQVRPGSILDHAQIVEGVAFFDPVGLVWSYNCITMQSVEVACAGFKGITKKFDPPSNTDGAMFVVQGGMTCKPFGFAGDDPAVKAAFNAKEPDGVSYGLVNFLFDTATDVTPASATLTPIQALGLAEAYGYLKYAGVPLIHVGPGSVSQLASQNALRVDGGKITTALGTPVVVASSYETNTAGKLDANQWVYVTGQVVLARSEAVLVDELNRATNDVTVLYERMYVAGVDCLIAKVKAKVF